MLVTWGTGRIACATGLGVSAGEAGAWAGGHASGAALGAFVGFVAGDVEFEESARRDVEFQTAAAAIDQRASSNREAALLLDDADGFARGAAGGPDIFDHENALAGFQFEAAAEGHLAGTVAFDEEGADAEGAGDFVSDNYAAECGRYDTCDGVVAENFREGAAQGFGVLRELEYERALDVCAAVTAAGKFEVALADGAYLLEEF